MTAVSLKPAIFLPRIIPAANLHTTLRGFGQCHVKVNVLYVHYADLYIYIDLLEHITAICPSVLDLRELFWTDIVNTFSVDICAELVGLSDDQFLITLLGFQTNFTLDQTEIYDFYDNMFYICKNCSCPLSAANQHT